MPPFPKPRFEFSYDVEHELGELQAHARARAVPRRQGGRLLLATWNIANLGLQRRRPDDFRLIAAIAGQFDLVALQEVNDDLGGLRALQHELPARFRVLFSDASGNRERLAFLYDQRKVTLLEKVGRVAIPPSQLDDIRLPAALEPAAARAGATRPRAAAAGTAPPPGEPGFLGFDRAPYVAAFQAGAFRFLLVNVHLFFGSERRADVERRALETFAVAWWAARRQRSRHAYTRDIVPLGDFNLPKLESRDPVHRALTARGLVRPPHSTRIGSSIATDRHYDQVVFFPGETGREFVAAGVFDFDGAVFRSLWDRGDPKRFFAYLRYYLSDHRPLWAEFRVDGGG